VLLVIPKTIIFVYPALKKRLLSWLLLAVIILLGGRLLIGSMPPRISQSEYFTQPRLPFITYFRASIMVLTMLCILAVDFADFPRSWAKTESFGTSLMDVGVGCIIFSTGLVSAQQFENGVSPQLMTSFKSSLSMLFLGLLRLGMVKFFGYQEHVSEYGLHWNFFLTLATLPLCTNLISRIVSIRRFITAGFILVSGYELLLRFTGLQTFILEGHRDNLLAMNKEGIFSMVGCCALFMLSCGYGSMIQNVRQAKVKNRAKLMLLKMTLFCMIIWAVYLALTRGLGLLPSRRLMNLTFVLWSAAVSISHVLLLFIMDITFMSLPGQSSLLLAINENQLLTFLLANLATGLVNVCFQTLLLSQEAALAILCGYALLLCTTAFVLKRLRIVLRLK